jgi:pimeloyl-ACP methyl ester carboxylesterase
MRGGLAILGALIVVAGSSQAAEAPGKTFDGPGGKLWYEVRGTATGRPLIVVNGGPGFDHSYLNWSTVWDRLAKSRRVVMYDQRGMGRSYALAPGAQNTLEEQIADLEALRAHLGADTVDLLGHSYGGYLAMAYTARNPAGRPSHAARLRAPSGRDHLPLPRYPVGRRQNSLGFASELGDRRLEATSKVPGH